MRKYLGLFLCLCLWGPATASGKPIRILSLDGGGTRGLIEALVLAELERQTGQRTIDMFDMIVGTSTGGLIAAALCCPTPQGVLPARDIVAFYQNEAQTIFQNTWWDQTQRTFGAARSKYDAQPLERLLQEKLGDHSIAHSLRPLGLPTFDLTTGRPTFITSHGLYDPTLHTIPTARAVRATTAAPIYFDPLHWQGRYFIDGGVFSNHPGLYGLRYAKDIFPNQEYMMISLGTGEVKTPEWQAGGVLQAGLPTLKILLTAPSCITDTMLHHELKENYIRLQPDLGDASIDLADTSLQSQERMQTIAAALVQSPRFKQMVERVQR